MPETPDARLRQLLRQVPATAPDTAFVTGVMRGIQDLRRARHRQNLAIRTAWAAGLLGIMVALAPLSAFGARLLETGLQLLQFPDRLAAVVSGFGLPALEPTLTLVLTAALAPIIGTFWLLRFGTRPRIPS